MTSWRQKKGKEGEEDGGDRNELINTTWHKMFLCVTWISRTGREFWDQSPNTHEASQDTRRTCTSGSYRCTCPQPGSIKLRLTFIDQREKCRRVL